MGQDEVDTLIDTGQHIVDLANSALADAVLKCRDLGATWRQLGASLGVSPQAAQQRWGAYRPDHAG